MTLSAKRVAALNEPGRYGDGRGLYLEVSNAGGRSWMLRYERSDTRPGRAGKRRERWMGLGAVADYTLEEARERARKARQLLNDGIDPIEARQTERTRQATEAALAQAASITFEECAKQYYNYHSFKWTNAKHSAEFISTLRRYAIPAFGKLPVAAINTALVLKALDPIWRTKTVTAGRVRGRIESVLDFAKTRGYRTGENPAAWQGNLVHALPAPGLIAKVAHHAALPYAEVPPFLGQLRGRQGIAARALEYTILTAARTGEVIRAQWSEFDLGGKVWTIPAQRMKMKKEHRVPLSDRAVEILTALPREAEFVFPGVTKRLSGINRSI